MDADKLDLASRLRRSKGRPGRTLVASTRLTEDEFAELEAAAAGQGKALSEWAREELIRAARRSGENPVFTEIIATRLMLNEVLHAVAVGETMTHEQYADILSVVRQDKHQVARDVLKQYSASSE